MRSKDLLDALAKRFAEPEWALFTEIALPATQSRADAIALNCWRSRGQELHGFEVKVDRRDWLRELKDPKKASAWFRYCDRWWLVLDDDAIVQEGELPEPWGLLVLKKTRLYTAKKAPKLEPAPLTHTIIAAMARRLFEGRKEDDRAAFERGVNAAEERMDDRTELGRARRRYQELEGVVKAFEEASGLRIQHYNGGAYLGRRVKLLEKVEHLYSDLVFAVRNIEQKRDRLGKLSDELLEAVSELKTLEEAAREEAAANEH